MKKSQIDEILSNVEFKINTFERRKIIFGYNWTKEFSKEAGIYGVFDKGKLIYIGETSSLKSRMKEFKRTHNHSLRRLLGKSEFNKKKNSNGKFDQKTEIDLNEYYEQNHKVVLVPVNFGRLEIESYFINNPENDLLNKPQKRSKK